MAEFGGVRLVQNAESQMRKAEALEKIILDIVNKITDIDEEIEIIVKGGISSDSSQEMLKTYCRNREEISNYIKQYAGMANTLYASAEAMKKSDVQAGAAAGGGM